METFPIPAVATRAPAFVDKPSGSGNFAEHLEAPDDARPVRAGNADDAPASRRNREHHNDDRSASLPTDDFESDTNTARPAPASPDDTAPADAEDQAENIGDDAPAAEPAGAPADVDADGNPVDATAGQANAGAAGTLPADQPVFVAANHGPEFGAATGANASASGGLSGSGGQTGLADVSSASPATSAIPATPAVPAPGDGPATPAAPAAAAVPAGPAQHGHDNFPGAAPAAETNSAQGNGSAIPATPAAPAAPAAPAMPATPALPAAPAAPAALDAGSAGNAALQSQPAAAGAVVPATPASPATGDGPATPALPASSALTAQAAHSADGEAAGFGHGSSSGDDADASSGGKPQDAAKAFGRSLPAAAGAATPTAPSADQPIVQITQPVANIQQAPPSNAGETLMALQGAADGDSPAPPTQTSQPAVASAFGSEIRPVGNASAITQATYNARAEVQPAVQQMAVQITRAVQNGNDRFTVELKPVALGRVTVKLEVGQDNRVIAVLSAERPETLELLQRDSRALEQALRNAGLNTDSGSLSFSLEGENEDGEETAGANGASFFAHDADGDDPATPAGYAHHIGSDSIDIRV